MDKPKLLELLRNQILIIVAESGSRGLAPNAFKVALSVHSFDVEDKELSDQLGYLQGKGFLDCAAAELSAGLSRYTLTAAGRDYLEANGLLNS